MKRNPLVPALCRVKRFVRNAKPELRVRAEGEVGLYPEKGAEKSFFTLKFDQDIAVSLLKATAVVLAVVAIADLLDD